MLKKIREIQRVKLRVVFKREKKRRKERKACATEKNLMMKLKFVIIN